MKPGETVRVKGREFVARPGTGRCNECDAFGLCCSQMPPCWAGTNPDEVDIRFEKVVEE